MNIFSEMGQREIPLKLQARMVINFSERRLNNETLDASLKL